jgi:DNA modification methylase
LNRKSIGFEIHRKYIDIFENRIKATTKNDNATNNTNEKDII